MHMRITVVPIALLDRSLYQAMAYIITLSRHLVSREISKPDRCTYQRSHSGCARPS